MGVLLGIFRVGSVRHSLFSRFGWKQSIEVRKPSFATNPPPSWLRAAYDNDQGHGCPWGRKQGHEILVENKFSHQLFQVDKSEGGYGCNCGKRRLPGMVKDG